MRYSALGRNSLIAARQTYLTARVTEFIVHTKRHKSVKKFSRSTSFPEKHLPSINQSLRSPCADFVRYLLIGLYDDLPT